MRVNDIELHVEVDGSGEPLVLLHGFTGSGQVWNDVRPLLASRARLVLVDLIGHGQSAAPDNAARYTAEWCVRDLLAIFDELEIEQANVLGYSMGGRVALRLALEAPGRVRRLLLESASPGIEDAHERVARVQADETLAERIEHDGLEAFVADWEQLPLLVPAAHVSGAVRAAVHAQRLRNTPHGLANSLRGMGAGRQPSLWSRLSEIQTPTHLLVGERDARYCQIAERMHHCLAHATLTVAPAAGHTVHVDQPARFTAWVDLSTRPQ